MSPDEAISTSEVKKTSEYPIYDTFPEHVDPDRFDYMELEELMRQTDDFMKKVASIVEEKGRVDSIFFLDKSARPLAYMFKRLFREYVPDETITPPQILYLNVGQELSLPDDGRGHSRKIGFSGNPDSMKKVYGKWVKPDTNVLVIDEYSSSGKSLKRAEEIVNDAFSDQGVNVTALPAFTKLPKWYHRHNYLGVDDRNVEDYLEYAREEADKELGTSYAHIKPDKYGRLSTDDVPMDVQLKRLDVERKVLHGDVGDFPTTKRRAGNQINPARKELRRMCDEIVKNRTSKK